ncbi:PAS domain-containing sensor histidine kinase [Rhodoflexus sp.]
MTPMQEFMEIASHPTTLTSTALLLYAAADEMHDPMCIKDTSGRYQWLNRAMLAMLGLKAKEEAIGKTDYDFFPVDLAEKQEREERDVMMSGKPIPAHEEVIIEPASGLLKWHQVTKSPFRDAAGNVLGVVIISRDVTARKEGEETMLHIQADLVQKEAAISALINNTDDWILAIDREYNITVVNEASRSAVQQSLGIYLTVGMSIFSIVQPEDVENWGRYCDRALTGETVVFEDAQMLGKGARFYEIAFHPIKDFQGDLFGASIFIRDISERKRIEAELKRLNNELATRLLEIQETQAHLTQSEKMRSLGQMAAGLAHELNTPIGYISSNADLIHERFNAVAKLYAAMLDGINLLTEQRFEEALERLQAVRNSPNGSMSELEETVRRTERLFSGIAAGLEQMTKLVASMKNFSRLDEADMKKADLHEGLKNSLVMIAHVLKEEKINVTVDYGHLPQIDCYPAQLNQVFLNLIQNAIHAVEKKADKKIHISTALENDMATIRISDNGCGIPKHVQSKIFEPFFTTKDVGKGTGLGLSICYDIVQKHGGELLFETKENEGTTFIVKIPAVEFAKPKEGAF